MQDRTLYSAPLAAWTQSDNLNINQTTVPSFIIRPFEQKQKQEEGKQNSELLLAQ